MPGIVGIFRRDRGQDSAHDLRVMLDCTTREKWHRVGTYTDDALGVYVGWIWHAGTYVDALPLWNSTRDVCLIMIGEEFSRPLSSRAPGTGAVAESTAAERILAQYEERGIDCVHGLNGGFNAVIVDSRAMRAFLFNDRYGLLRLHCHANEQALYFASEPKPILRLLPETRRLDVRGLGEYLSLGCVIQNRTLFSGINLLPGGSLWSIAPGESLRRGTTFDPAELEALEALPASRYEDELRSLWPDVLDRYFKGPQRVGLSMTGGLDSRMILAWANKAPGTLPCYTFGGPFRECNDVRLAREAATLCHQPHEVVTVSGEFLSEFPALAEQAVLISGGAMDVTGAVDVYVQRRAREIAPVRLSGVNGGELLRNVINFGPRPLNRQIFSGDVIEAASLAARTYEEETRGHPATFVSFKQAPWQMATKLGVEHSQLTFRTPYFDNDLVRLSYQVPSALRSSKAPALGVIAAANPALARMGTDRGLRVGGIPGLARLENLYQEFTFRAEYAYDYGMPQWLAKVDNVLSPLHLERLFLGRHKIHHFRWYYRHELAGYVRDVLLDPRSRQRWYLQGDSLRKLVDGHLGGQHNYTIELHKVLACELINRHLVEQA